MIPNKKLRAHQDISSGTKYMDRMTGNHSTTVHCLQTNTPSMYHGSLETVHVTPRQKGQGQKMVQAVIALATPENVRVAAFAHDSTVGELKITADTKSGI